MLYTVYITFTYVTKVPANYYVNLLYEPSAGGWSLISKLQFNVLKNQIFLQLFCQSIHESAYAHVIFKVLPNVFPVFFGTFDWYMCSEIMNTFNAV